VCSFVLFLLLWELSYTLQSDSALRSEPMIAGSPQSRHLIVFQA
jgi:hypothetical protein